ncbi:hypothetical protein ColTof4_11917 [Colletotrichum tofieldiae]|nr:hypothetical protein ColTof3_03010 [Colletotrichum tofieldiae]GKT79494.1 hypothetical protein ColTof4_11917 [Colletotrichum tofieldiae]
MATRALIPNTISLGANRPLSTSPSKADNSPRPGHLAMLALRAFEPITVGKPAKEMRMAFQDSDATTDLTPATPAILNPSLPKLLKSGKFFLRLVVS